MLTWEIAKPWPGQTIVVTHHAPSAAVPGPLSELSPAFASDLDDWIDAHRPDYWFFGHTRRQLSERIHGTPIVNVSLGYLDEGHGAARPGSGLSRIRRQGQAWVRIMTNALNTTDVLLVHARQVIALRRYQG